MTEVEKIKSALQAELGKTVADPAVIAKLTDELLDLNSGSVRFTVDAGHINRLGYELVGKQETALSELIKNAYDADAVRVEIRFQNYDRPGGTLIIKDDGEGMTDETIRKTWMRLSTPDKINNPKSNRFGRQRAGRKGIGRFAVQRLGTKLTLFSGRQGDAQGIRVEFNWDKTFTSGTDLGHVWNSIGHYDKPLNDHGTRLVIEDLRDGWTKDYFERVWRSVVFLQPPFPLSKNVAQPSIDPGFEVEINGSRDGKVDARFDLEHYFLYLALAVIEGTIDKNGQVLVRR